MSEDQQLGITSSSCILAVYAIVVVGASWKKDEVEQSPCLPEMNYKM